MKKDGFSVDGTDLTFRDGDRVVFTARLLPEPRVAKADQPAPEKPSPPNTPPPEKSPPPPAPDFPKTGENPDEITNSIGMKLKLIGPGKFPMGSPKDEEGRHDERGAAARGGDHARPFYMGRTR